jgi:hypothetical protein
VSDHDDHQPSGDEEDDLEARRRFLGEGFESTFFMREIDRPDAVAIREALLARGIDPRAPSSPSTAPIRCASSRSS